MRVASWLRPGGTAPLRQHVRLYRRMAADVIAAGLVPRPVTAASLSEADLAGLPATVQRYLKFMCVVGRPPDWSFLTHLTGRFRLRPRLPWMRCEVWQYSSSVAVARLFHMRIHAGVLRMTGRDAYLSGRGRMSGKLAGLVPVAAGSGPEYDVGELTTYLNDAVLLAPSMLLSLPVTWAETGDNSFDVTLEDAGRRVSGRVFLDERGAPVNFSTNDRWCALPGGLVQTRWSTPVEGWAESNGRWLPARGSAVWDLPDGPFSYAQFQFRPDAIRYNVPPAEFGPVRLGPTRAVGTGGRGLDGSHSQPGLLLVPTTTLSVLSPCLHTDLGRTPVGPGNQRAYAPTAITSSERQLKYETGQRTRADASCGSRLPAGRGHP